MLQLTYMGEDFEFSRCKWETKETGSRYIWHILARNKTSVVKISCSCTRQQMLSLQYETPEGKKEKQPPLAGAGGTGTIRLYRRESGDRVLIDTLKMENAFCICGMPFPVS